MALRACLLSGSVAMVSTLSSDSLFYLASRFCRFPLPKWPTMSHHSDPMRFLVLRKVDQASSASELQLIEVARF